MYHYLLVELTKQITFTFQFHFLKKKIIKNPLIWYKRALNKDKNYKEEKKNSVKHISEIRLSPFLSCVIYLYLPEKWKLTKIRVKFESFWILLARNTLLENGVEELNHFVQILLFISLGNTVAMASCNILCSVKPQIDSFKKSCFFQSWSNRPHGSSYFNKNIQFRRNSFVIVKASGSRTSKKQVEVTLFLGG